MPRRKKVTTCRGIISSLDFHMGLVEVKNELGNHRFTILPENLSDTDGNFIDLDELRLGDCVLISEVGHIVSMKVLKAV
ncbi:MAG: hypothetical protein M0021_01495 [Clostridia bacterium]|uniref:Uncharacterized protein n=1 Tax=Desulforamulus aeronauticus DSM 10349 TaxID=1121421 RepID=A0A1M6X6Y4_9FIRM|nr:hypothetical protein [Desulforamulus aeronauticus]MDA8210549.1 hypothetical protein [Clostridia bacterium]SHL01760.1 hypothetical protein SAMN02745123_03927 [Desulforamulus aeronauticus DSM 10349]